MSRVVKRRCPMCGWRIRRTEGIAYVTQDGRTLVFRKWIHAQYGWRQPNTCSQTRLKEFEKTYEDHFKRAP